MKRQGFLVRGRSKDIVFLSKKKCGTDRTELIRKTIHSKKRPPEHEAFAFRTKEELLEMYQLMIASRWFVEMTSFKIEKSELVAFMFKHKESELALQLIWGTDRPFD